MVHLFVMGIRQVASFVVREFATAIWRWAEEELAHHIVTKAREWMEDGWDWVVEKITGKRPTQWEGSTLKRASLEATLQEKNSSLEAQLSSLFATPAGEAYLKRWLKPLLDDSGVRDAAIRWHVDSAPIPNDVSLSDWASNVAKLVGLTAQEVLDRRLSRL